MLRWIYDKPLYKRPPLGNKPSFLEEKDDITLGTSFLFKRVLTGLKESKSYVNGAIEEYLTTFSSNIEQFKIESEPEKYDDELVEKERIITGTLEGIPFKCKIDSLNLSGGYFIDLKTMESLQSEKYSTTLHRYTKSLLYNIVEYQYTLQMYVYQELLKQTYGYEFTPYIMAVSKEPVPDKELILIDDTIIEMGRDIFYGHVEALKDALAHKSVEGCGHCDYCLTNKSLVTAKTVAEFLQQ